MSPIPSDAAAYALAAQWWWRWGSELYQYLRDDYVLNPTRTTCLMSIFLVLVTTSITVSLSRWWRWPRKVERSPLPPGPRGLPVLGNLPFIGTELHLCLAKLANKYGPIMKLRLGGKLCIVVTSPSLAKEVLKDHDIIFANRDVPAVANIAFNGATDIIWSQYGNHWRMLRKVSASEMLNQKKLEAQYGLRRRAVHHMVSQLYSEAGSPVDVGEQMLLTNFNNITTMLWGGGGDKLEGEEQRRATAEIRRLIYKVVELHGVPNISDLFPALAWLDIQGIGRRMKKIISRFDRKLDSVIDQRLKRESLRREARSDDVGNQVDDFLQLLLRQLADNTTPGLTISHVKTLLLDMIVGGVESTSMTVEWALAELLKHPHIKRKAQEELEEVVGLNNMVEESHLPKLHYLHGVVKETLRLHPVAPILVPHCPSESCTVGGFMIPMGSKVIVNAWAIHRDPMSWDNPLEFQPERFLRSADEFDFNGNDFRYIPFGSGRRVCVGIPLAERMVPYLLASLLHSFQWQMPNGVELDMSEKFGFALKRATPLVAIPSPRLSDLTLYN